MERSEKIMPLIPFSSPQIHYGRGSLKVLRRLQGKKALIITDKVLREIGIVDKVTKQLKKSKEPMEVKIFDEVEPNPKDTTVKKGAEIAREFNPDWIIGLGGGSALDAAKMISVLYERPDLAIRDINPMVDLGKRQKATLLTIPTTSGTGAEVTWGIVITDSVKHYKISVGHAETVPDMAIIDFTLAMSMPPKITAMTGIDALVHAIEGYTASVKNDYAEGLCLKAIQMVFNNLPLAFKDGSDNIAREKMHNAATIAGLGFGNSQAGLAHSAGHSLGAIFSIPHGIAVGLMVPYVIEFNEKTSEADYKEINKFMGFSGEGSNAKILSNEVRKLLKELELPTTIKELVPEDKFKESFELAKKLTLRDPSSGSSARSLKAEEVEPILMAAYEGKSVNF